jgi:hypothetical protein
MPVTITQARQLPGARRGAGFRQPGALTRRVRALMEREPERLWKQVEIARGLGLKRCDIENCLTNMVVSGELIEFSEGLGLRTPQMLKRAKAQAETAAAKVATAAIERAAGEARIAEAARQIVERAHVLRRFGDPGQAAALLAAAAERAPVAAIAENFGALAALFADCLGPYREIGRAEALQIAAANGWDGEGLP